MTPENGVWDSRPGAVADLVASAPVRTGPEHGQRAASQSKRLAQTWRDSNGEVWAVCEQVGSRRRLDLPDVGRFELDLDSGRIIGRRGPGVDAADFERLSWKEAVPMLHQANGALCLHASAIGTERGAVALVGSSTAGKSSLARAWSERGGGAQLADDVAVIYRREERFELHPLPFYTNVWGAVRGALERPDLEVGSAPDPLPLVALVFVQPSKEAAPEILPLAAEALPTLLSESSCFLLDDDEVRAQFYTSNLDLLSMVPCRSLAYPHQLDRLSATLDLLEALSAADSAES